MSLPSQDAMFRVSAAAVVTIGFVTLLASGCYTGDSPDPQQDGAAGDRAVDRAVDGTGDKAPAMDVADVADVAKDLADARDVDRLPDVAPGDPVDVPDGSLDRPLDVLEDRPSDPPGDLSDASDVPCEAGTHREGSACIDNITDTCCGNSCAVCSGVVTNGAIRCASRMCMVVCSAGYSRMNDGPCLRHNRIDCCGPACVVCPPVTNGTPSCNAQDMCAFSCNPGFHPDGNTCVANETPECCGTSCAVCPAIANGVRRCQNGGCDPTCNRGYQREGTAPSFSCVPSTSLDCCGTSCTSCPAVANAVAMCLPAGCAFTCNSGYHKVDARCEANTTADCCGPSCAVCTVTRPNSSAACAASGTSCAAPSPCVSTHHDCSGTCQPKNSVDSCGTLCTPCAARPNATVTCNGTGCIYTCIANFDNCDNDMSNGCEVDLRSNKNHCNACGHACAGGGGVAGICANRACALDCPNTPTARRGDCDRNPANGCEVDLLFDNLNCGSCHPNQAGDPNNMVNHPGEPACTAWNQDCSGGLCLDK